MSNPWETKEREIKGLLGALEEFGLEEGTIVTSKAEGEETIQRNAM